MFEDKRRLQAQIIELKRKLVLGSDKKAQDNNGAVIIENIAYTGRVINNVDLRNLRELVDSHKEKIRSGIILIININLSKVNLICGVTDDLTSEFSAVEIVRMAAEITGGKGGGGRPDMAQAGGADPSKAEKAIEIVRNFISTKRQK